MKLEADRVSVPDGITEIWQKIVNSVAIFFSVPGIMINCIEPPELVVCRASDNTGSPFPSGTRMPMEGLYCTDVAVRRRKLQVTDANSDPDWAESPTAKAGIIAYLGVPLLWPDGRVFGTLCAIDTKRKEWDEQAETLLQTLKDAIESHLALVMRGEDISEACTELESAINEVLTLHGFSHLVSSCK